MGWAGVGSAGVGSAGLGWGGGGDTCTIRHRTPAWSLAAESGTHDDNNYRVSGNMWFGVRVGDLHDDGVQDRTKQSWFISLP